MGMADYDYDFFVIGAGSGGVRASRLAASFGARVAVAEERFLGGTCVNVGCIPKKLLVYASVFREEVAEAQEGYGWSLQGLDFDWPRLIENKNREIARLNGVYQKLLDAAGVESMEGRATLVGPHTVAIGGRTLSARHILVATGSSAFRPPEIEGIEHAITSDEAFYLDALPGRVIVVGGGYIAVEFAGIFHGMGSDVCQLYRGPMFLRGFDDDLRQHLAGEMRGRGIDLRFDSVPVKIERTGGGIRATLSDGQVLEADHLLCATAPELRGSGSGRTRCEKNRQRRRGGGRVFEYLTAEHPRDRRRDRSYQPDSSGHSRSYLPGEYPLQRPPHGPGSRGGAGGSVQPAAPGHSGADRKRSSGALRGDRRLPFNFSGAEADPDIVSNALHDETRGGPSQRSRGGSSYGRRRSGRDRPGFCSGGSRGA
jgi:thioredoxin reductase